ncbi:heterokaryon incompatibility protein-domain-containing protein, partial [Podospora conica]
MLGIILGGITDQALRFQLLPDLPRVPNSALCNQRRHHDRTKSKPQLEVPSPAPMASSTTTPCLPYVYKPLPSPSYTRIVELLPAAAQQAAPLRCRLVPLDLDDDDTPCGHEALSYTWGPPVFSEQLFIHGDSNEESDAHVLHITPSLASALRSLRRGDIARRIWADAVCINQHDTDEKGRQIPLMSSIYRGASRVVAWLDSGGTDAEVRARRLNTLMRRRAMVGREAWPPESVSEAAALLKDHLSIPWFSRRWIIQEVVGNADVVLHCGQEETGWLSLMVMVTEVFRDDKAPPAVVTSVLMMYNLWRMWVLGEPRSGKCRLMTLLERFEHFGCVDARDRIYAIAALAEDGYGKDALVSINMDYSIPVERLYLEFAQALVSVGHLPWVLQQACARRCTSRGLPSWVPDWRIPTSTKTIRDESARVLEWKASVDPFGISTHALTADLCCVRTWKGRAFKDGFLKRVLAGRDEAARRKDNAARRKDNAARRGTFNLLRRMGPKDETPVPAPTKRVYEVSANYAHLDVCPLQIEWKNSYGYPHGGGTSAPDLRQWIFQTATDIQTSNSRDEAGAPLSAYNPSLDVKFREVAVALGHLLLEGCRPKITSLDGNNVEMKELDRYITGRGDPSAKLETLIRDIDTLMVGRCIFTCRIRSPLNTPLPAPRSTGALMGIGPSETEAGDCVLS